MIESIFLIIFVLSFGGLIFIILRKIPVLKTLPHNGTTGFKKHHYILEAEHKIKNILVFFEKQILLHKLLSWIKVLTLKVEVRVDSLLHGLRKKAQKVDKKLNEKK